MSKRAALVATLLSVLLAGGALVPKARAGESATGEYSRTPVAPRAAWKASLPATRVARLAYGELPMRRLLDLQRRPTHAPKAERIGLPRRADLEASRVDLPALQWARTGDGGSAARIEIRSPDALALRVGLRVDRLDDRAELRFAGSDEPWRVVAVMRGEDVKRLTGDDGLFWTPSTDGERQLIEIYRPAAAARTAVRLAAPRLSHLLANSRNDFKILPKIGESGSCNVDTACRVGELGTHFINAKNAVAHMQFVRAGSTYICTGTLLADGVTETQLPFFYSANHCFDDDSSTFSTSAMQSVANTLNTFWNYESTSCGSGVSAARTQVAGGAAYLYSDRNTDAMLLRLNNPAPAGAFFAGWNSSPLPSGSSVFAIHHPAGDAKKVSEGQHVATSPSLQTVGWLNGTTEGGSSGSALFTRGGLGWELRGGLYGGWASCANTGSLSNTNNRDEYSRFDVVFAQIRGYLAPMRRNGGRPLPPPTYLVKRAEPQASNGAVAPPAPATRTRPVHSQARAVHER